MEDKLHIISTISATIGIVWLMFSVAASTVVVNQDLCDKDYPIGRVLYTKMFCEIKGE